MRSRLALVLLCLLPACSMKCNTRRSGATEQAETMIRTMAERVDTVQRVTCPEIKRTVGAQAECEVVFHDGTRHPVDVTLTDKDGGTLSARWKKQPLGANDRAELMANASRFAGVSIALRCNDDKVVGLGQGEVLRCTMDTARDGKADVLVYFKPESGWTFRLATTDGSLQPLHDAFVAVGAESSAVRLGKMFGEVTSAECDKIVGAKVGSPVSCTVRFADGVAHQAAGEVRLAARGDDFAIWLTWARDLVSQRFVEEQMAPALDKHLGEAVTTRCPITGVQEVPAEGIPCTVTDKDGRTRRIDLVKVGDELGWTEPE